MGKRMPGQALAPQTVISPEESGRGYHVHVGTGNRSFVEVSEILRASGVRNCEFMLALIDPGLDGVDPHRGDLEEDQMIRILAECIRNPWYFFREVVRIPVPGGTVSFKLHLGNLFLLWSMAANINCFLLLPRQNFKTVSACAFYAWAYCFGTTNSHMLFFNKELGDSKNNLKRTKNLIEELPEWLLDGVLTDPVGDFNNIEYLQSGHRGNRIDAKPSGKDQAHADKLGRGATTPLVWYDEIAFAKYIRETYMAAAPAGSQAKETAKAMGRPYGTCVTTTPNNLDDPSGEFAFQMLSGALRFRLEFYDFGPKRVIELIDSKAEYPFLFAEYSYKELGRTEEWFRTQCRELMNDAAKIKRELLLIWPMSGEGSVFTEEQFEELRKYAKPIIASIPIRPVDGAYVPPGVEMTFVEMPDPAVSYVLGVDTSSGEGLDYTSITMSHPADMRTVANLETNTSDDSAVKVIVSHVMNALFPKSVAVVERNYLGIVVVKHLLKDPRTTGRVFYMDKLKEAERTIKTGRGPAARRKVKTRVYGLTTTAQSREAMMMHLIQIVTEAPHLITHPAVQGQILTLHRRKNGRIDHRSGFHDDNLMAYLLTVYADRADQPVLMGMIGRNRSPEAAGKAVDAMLGRVVVREVVQDEYEGRAAAAATEDTAARRRRRIAGAVTAMNAGGSWEVPL